MVSTSLTLTRPVLEYHVPSRVQISPAAGPTGEMTLLLAAGLTHRLWGPGVTTTHIGQDGRLGPHAGNAEAEIEPEADARG